MVKHNNLRCLNAAKLSLLLAQTVARLGGNCTSLTLGHVIVKLSTSSSAVNDRGNTGTNAHDAVSDAVNFDTTPLDFNANPSFDTNDVPLYFASYLIDIDEQNRPLETSEESSSAREAHAYVMAESRHPAQTQSQRSSDKDKFVKINAASESGHEVHWTILGMEIQANAKTSTPSRTSDNPHYDLQKMQLLGKLIYGVFSPQAEQSLPAIFEKLLILGVGEECNDKSDQEQRSRKLQRCNGKTFFDDLLQSGHYLVSVCRLLSDMIDIGSDGMADSPFATLEDVIDDLQQMSTHPQIYLDDPENGFLSKLRFGLGCYGRKEQITKILRVASHIDSSKPESTDCVEAIFVSGTAGSGKVS